MDYTTIKNGKEVLITKEMEIKDKTNQLLALFRKNLPEEKSCLCNRAITKVWGCECGANSFNACRKEMEKKLDTK